MMRVTSGRTVRAILGAGVAVFGVHGIPFDITGSTSDSHVTVTASEAAAQGAPTSGASQSGRIEEWKRSPACFNWAIGPVEDTCLDDGLGFICADGTEALDPWWMRYRRTDGTWSAWTMMSNYQCSAEIFANALAHAWAEMPIAPNTITIQPNTGWVLTTVPTIVYVDRAPRTRNVTLLGTPVRIRATASAYTWTWGDGAQTVTTQPGAAYPNATVSHTYMYAERDVVVRLTTSWRGSYSTNGGASWSSAPGVAHTTSTPIPLHVYNPHSERVDCDLNGTCNTGADGPADG
jgi:hypothetical protein